MSGPLLRLSEPHGLSCPRSLKVLPGVSFWSWRLICPQLNREKEPDIFYPFEFRSCFLRFQFGVPWPSSVRLAIGHFCPKTKPTITKPAFKKVGNAIAQPKKHPCKPVCLHPWIVFLWCWPSFIKFEISLIIHYFVNVNKKRRFVKRENDFVSSMQHRREALKPDGNRDEKGRVSRRKKRMRSNPHPLKTHWRPKGTRKVSQLLNDQIYEP